MAQTKIKTKNKKIALKAFALKDFKKTILYSNCK